MAGDWIKMRCDLWDDPRVVSIKRSMKLPHAAIVGGLFRLWVLADQHSEDGELFGYTAADLDALCGKKGWADALAAVGWLELFPDKIVVPRFEEHNGKSGKKRAQDYKDQQRHRGKGSVRNPSGA